MADEKMSVQEQIKETVIDVRNEAIVQTANLYLLARKVLLAGMGAVALTVEEAQEFVEKLVERGEIAEADAQKLMQEVRKRARRSEKEMTKAAHKAEKSTKGVVKKAEGALEETVESVLKGLNVPSKTDVDALSKKISELSRKVDALRGA